MKVEVIKVTDLIEAINSLPNCSNGFSDVRIGVRIMFVTNTWEQVLQARIRPLYPYLWMLDNVLFGTII